MTPQSRAYLRTRRVEALRIIQPMTLDPTADTKSVGPDKRSLGKHQSIIVVLDDDSHGDTATVVCGVIVIDA